jgi:GNAT superfamily N-acetyltransferase
VIAMPLSAVRAAHGSDLEAVTAVLSEAFLYADLAPWLIPSLADRDRIYPHYFAMLAEHALAHGTVAITQDRAAVALWYAHDGRPLPAIADYDARLAQSTAPYTARFVALDDAMHRHHPHDEPHHYLAFLAVHPDRQRHGYGSHLLRHHHDYLDATATAAYLEATGTRTGQLYARHGYQPRPAYALARDSPRLYPMWRPAQAGTHREGGTEPVSS